MAKFSGSSASTQRAPIVATNATRNFERHSAWEMDAKGELFLLAATNMSGELTHYETGAQRDARFRKLVIEVTQSDPKWMQGFAPYLRRELKMRSASVVLACEYVRAGGPEGRKIIDAVCQRADEPAEVLSYWVSHYGRNLPFPVKKGVADAVRRLYTERNILKYDSARHAMQFADVVEFVHPKPKTPGQEYVFKYLLDERHHNDGQVHEWLPILVARSRLQGLSPAERHAFARRVHSGDDVARTEFLLASANSWEWGKSWLGEA